jgi:hypothetical protein
MASSTNYFAALTSSQEPSQLVSNASNAAKNRRKKERKKHSRANEQPAAEGVAAHAGAREQPMQAPNEASSSADKQASSLIQQASKADYWAVWDSWIRGCEVRSVIQCPSPCTVSSCDLWTDQ